MSENYHVRLISNEGTDRNLLVHIIKCFENVSESSKICFIGQFSLDNSPMWGQALEPPCHKKYFGKGVVMERTCWGGTCLGDVFFSNTKYVVSKIFCQGFVFSDAY